MVLRRDVRCSMHFSTSNKWVGWSSLYWPIENYCTIYIFWQIPFTCCCKQRCQGLQEYTALSKYGTFVQIWDMWDKCKTCNKNKIHIRERSFITGRGGVGNFGPGFSKKLQPPLSRRDKNYNPPPLRPACRYWGQGIPTFWKVVGNTKMTLFQIVMKSGGSGGPPPEKIFEIPCKNAPE